MSDHTVVMALAGWEPIYAAVQQPAQTEADAQPMPAMCGDCAFRPGSPERSGDQRAAKDAADLDQLVESFTPFWCHDGLATPVGWSHDGLGVELTNRQIAADFPDLAEALAAELDYDPLVVAGRPYRLDGRPASYCAGWTARTLHHHSIARTTR